MTKRSKEYTIGSCISRQKRETDERRRKPGPRELTNTQFYLKLCDMRSPRFSDGTSPPEASVGHITGSASERAAAK